MKTVNISPSEMVKHISRFKDLRPQSAYYDEASGIPDEAYQMITAKTLYTLLAPRGNAGPMSASPAVQSDEALSIVIAECPPDDRPMLHAHFNTTEHFICLSGRFRIRWGDEGQHETYLDPYDMIAVPRGVCRDFTNVTSKLAYLLVIITGGNATDYNDIGIAPSEGQLFKDAYGEDVAEKVESIGFSFLKND